MSSNEKDAFDTLMEEFVPAEGADDSNVTEDNEASPAEEEVTETSEEDAGAPADEDAEEEVSEDDSEEEASEDEDEDETSDDSEEELEEEAEEKPKKKHKKTAAERISEVVAKQRAAERELAAERAEKAEILRRLEQLESGGNKEHKPEITVPAGEELGLKEPSAEDLDDKGEPKYPLGTFDPNYVRDLTRYDRAVERAHEKKIAEQEAEAAKQQAEADKLFTEWNKKLVEAEKTSPEIRKKAENLVDAFSDAEPTHIQTIAQTIMQLENGPSVLEYLADNLDEADTLVKMGTPRALLQLGRLDGLFTDAQEDTAPPVKQTKAPKPPVNLGRGVSSRRETAKTLYDKMLSEFN